VTFSHLQVRNIPRAPALQPSDRLAHFGPAALSAWGAGKQSYSTDSELDLEKEDGCGVCLFPEKQSYVTETISQL